MNILTLLLTVVALFLLLGTLYILLLTLAGMRRLQRSTLPQQPGRIAIVVPAHYEAQGIGRTLDNLQILASQDGNTEIVVVADNCSDSTAEVVAASGTRVLVRMDEKKRGKGYALDYAFHTLEAEGFFAYVVIDADSVAEATLLPALRQSFAAGAQAVQTRYAALTEKSNIASLALAAFNILRPRGRHQLGLSAGILGNGFALRREVLQRVPYTAASIVEDLEYHLQLLCAGIRVHFCDHTTVYGEMPENRSASTSQRLRWEGGRLRMLLDFGGPLAKALLRGQWRMADPLADLLLLPLALHVSLLVALVAIPVQATQIIGVAGLLVVFLHVSVAASIGQVSCKCLLQLIAKLPAYLFWKLTLIPQTLSSARQETNWVRTERNSINQEVRP